MKKAPMYQVGPYLYSRAALYGLVVALVGGFLVAASAGFVGRIGGFFGLSLLLLLFLGYAVGEAVNRGARGRLSTGLTVMAGAFTVFAVVAGSGLAYLARLSGDLPLWLRLQVAFGASIESLLGNIMGLLLVALAVVIATSRVR